MAFSLDSMSPAEKKSFFIKVGVIVVCFAGAAIAYLTMDSQPQVKVTPEIIQAETRAVEIQKQIESTPVEPPPPEIERVTPRKKIKMPGT